MCVVHIYITCATSVWVCSTTETYIIYFIYFKYKKMVLILNYKTTCHNLYTTLLVLVFDLRFLLRTLARHSKALESTDYPYLVPDVRLNTYIHELHIHTYMSCYYTCTGVQMGASFPQVYTNSLVLLSGLSSLFIDVCLPLCLKHRPVSHI